MSLKIFAAVMFVILIEQTAFAQNVQDRLKALEAEIQRLQQEVESLRSDVSAQGGQEATPPTESPTKATNREFSNQILVPDLGADEREHQFEGKPEIVQVWRRSWS